MAKVGKCFDAWSHGFPKHVLVTDFSIGLMDATTEYLINSLELGLSLWVSTHSWANKRLLAEYIVEIPTIGKDNCDYSDMCVSFG
jgi:hypothetical protein